MFTERTPLILIVDDDIFIRGMLKNLLKGKGYDIVVAGEGTDALEKFQNHSPDLVLMDAAMPVMDGFTACAKLKKLPGGNDIPVIMITSLDDEASVDKAFTVGAAEYITKPVHWAVLKHRVEILLQARFADIALRKSEVRHKRDKVLLHIADKVFELTSDAILIADTEGSIINANQSFLVMTDYKYEKILGQNFSFLQSKKSDNYTKIWDTVNDTGYWDGEVWQLYNDDKDHLVWISISAIREEGNNITHYVVMYSDKNSGRS